MHNRYEYSPVRLSQIFAGFSQKEIAEEGIEAALGWNKEDQHFWLFGDLEKSGNVGLVADIQRETLQVNGKVQEIKGEFPAEKRKDCLKKVGMELGEENANHLFKKNFYVQEIIKWNFSLLQKLFSKEYPDMMIFPKNTKENTCNLIIKDAVICIISKHAGFIDRDGKSVMAELEAEFQLIDEKGFRLQHLISMDKRFEDLVKSFEKKLLENIYIELVTSLKKAHEQKNQEKRPKDAFYSSGSQLKQALTGLTQFLSEFKQIPDIVDLAPNELKDFIFVISGFQKMIEKEIPQYKVDDLGIKKINDGLKTFSAELTKLFLPDEKESTLSKKIKTV